MIPELRRAYNAAYSEDRYRAYQRSLEAEAGCPIEFRVAETPVFLPKDLLDRMLESAHEILTQLVSDEHQRFSLKAVPAEFDVPNCDEHPLFIQVDFAITRDDSSRDGELGFKLIELQGFPSLYGFQLIQGLELQKLLPDDQQLDFLLSGLNVDGYRRVVGEAILGGQPPGNVVLLDLDPPAQKTFPDFALHEKLWGIRPICPSTVERRGNQLWYERDGKWNRILRAYNRVVFEELKQKKLRLPFSYTQPLDLEWAGHPNWYFRWSKHSLLWLDHPTVPKVFRLSELECPPDDLENWVLKPLFSFSGHCVKVDLSAGDLEAVPREHRDQTLLMQKVEYAPVIETADGNASKCELRLMFVWRDGAPRAVNTLARLSQGKMMGVDYNKDRTWVGSSSSFWPAG
jgi:hypothetical protein